MERIWRSLTVSAWFRRTWGVCEGSKLIVLFPVMYRLSSCLLWCAACVLFVSSVLLRY